MGNFLDYFTTPPPPPPASSARDADPRRVFFAFLPGAIFIALLLGWAMFEDGDSRNVGGAMCMFAMAPVALGCAPQAAAEARRPRGMRAFWLGVLWCAILVGGLCGALWIIIEFELLR